MPNDIGGPDAPYNTQIPAYNENADIQTALRLYHYGEDTDAPDPLVSNSIAGHLTNLEDTKIDKVPATIPSAANLNSYTTSGYFIQPSVTNARTGLNYPTFPDSLGVQQIYSGLLKVVNSGAIVLHEYHMLGDTGYPVNRVFWRMKYLDVWSSWIRSYSQTDIVAITDARYPLKSDVYTKTAANNAFAPKYFYENEYTVDHTLVIEDINEIVSMNVVGGGVLTIPLNTTAAFPIGSIVNVYNRSETEFLEIAGAPGVTVRNPGTIEPYQEASLRKRGTNEWVASGPVY